MRDAAAVAVPSVVVTFTTNPTFGVFVPPSGTALTDATGTATVTLNPANLSAAGAATLTATAQVPAVTASIGYSVGAANVTLTNFTFGTNPLSAFGTTSVSVTVNSNGVPVTSPQTVNFSSPCAASGKAALTASVLTGAGGVATASYRDSGCGGTDTVTASVSGFAPASGVLTITPPVAGSIQFVSATPTSITLKGTGGAGRQESSLVIFKVVDTGGFPIGGKTVTFSLSTSVGGITLTNTTAISDATTGEAVVTVNAGTIATPVRVLASTPGSVAGTTLTTQSDQLTITTGIPAQASFSLSAVTLNIEGLNFDGVTTVLTARLADHFSNAVPDGTTVNFIAEGGSVCNPLITPCLGACNTTAGACSVTMTSQNFRPLNGRVTVLAYAIGEESFTDIDGDGVASLVNHFNGTTEMVDANGASTDTGEAFLDNNEDGVRDFIGASTALEEFIDFNTNGLFDPPDGKYNGVLCNEPPTGTSSAGTCSAQRSINVFRNLPIIFSGSGALVQFSDSSRNAIAGITFPPCINGTPFTPTSTTVLITVTDVNGNIMPAGTTVSFTTDNGTIQSTPTSFTVLNSTACLAGAGPGPSGFTCPSSAGGTRCVLNVPAEGAGFICPTSSEVLFGSAPLTYSVIVKTQATQSAGTCTAPSNSPGRLSVTVTTPKGIVTTKSISVTN